MSNKIKVSYYREASDLAQILLDNGYKNVKIEKVYNYPLTTYYIVSYEDLKVGKGEWKLKV